MALPDSFIQSLVDRCDVVDVVSKYVNLKKSGNSYFGLCPFHGEKTPSFSVSQDKQIFHCFGCSEGGGVIGFIMKIEGLNFIEAVKFLAAMYGIEVPDDGTTDEFKNKRERLLALNRDAARHFNENLKKSVNKQALAYLFDRGLSGKTITTFGVGFAPESWDDLVKAMTELGYTKNELIEGGLASKNQSGGAFDRFRNRIMFPIIDIRGNVVAFGGRVMDNSMPKYINSSDTLVYSKSRNLFAINLSKKTKRKNLILAEGYMDVIALHQAGFDNAVASLGTSLTEEQAQLMARYTSQVIICYDADEAGQKATKRAMDILSRAAISVRVLKVSGAKDPDEYIKKNGADAFEKLIERPQMGHEYSIGRIREKYDLGMNDEKIAYLKEVTTYIASIYSEVEREIYSRTAAAEAGVTPLAFLAEVAKLRAGMMKKERKSMEREALDPVRNVQPKARELKYTNVKSALAEEKVLAMVLTDSDYLKAAAKKLTVEMFSSTHLGGIYGVILEKYNEREPLSLGLLVNYLEPIEAAHITAVVSGYRPSRNGQRELEDYIAIIQTEYLKNNKDTQDSLLEAIKRKRSGENGG